MNAFIRNAVILASALGASAAMAESCRTVHWTPGQIINVKSAMYLGTRISFPSDLVVNPPTSNKELWDSEGAANTLLVKPNSEDPAGAAVILRAMTTDGNVYDIKANRSTAAQNETCVIVTLDGKFFSQGSRNALAANSAQLNQYSAAAGQQNAALQQELQAERRKSADAARDAVMEALSRYRYHIYTRYQWDQGKGFAATGLISDVYDDGRWTYIRLNTPNRGLLSVESEIGEKNAIVPFKYNDRYGMYQINGIYPSFTLRVDDVKITVSRADAKTQGE